MSINFLNPSCSGHTNKVEFGLCDDPSPSKEPAYLDESNPSIWIAKVNNAKQENVTFYAIDNCVTVLKPEGGNEKRCDGLLLYSNKLIFVELKSRKSTKWFKKGREQITATINKFKLNHDISTYANVEAYVCNNLKPFTHSGQASNIQKFKNDTGYILKSSRNIDLG